MYNSYFSPLFRRSSKAIFLALILALMLACESEPTATPTSTPEPTATPLPVYDPVFQAWMVEILEKQLVQAQEIDNEELIECLTLMQDAYSQWRRLQEDFFEDCEPILGEWESELPTPE